MSSSQQEKTPHEILDELLSSEEALKPVNSLSHDHTTSTLKVPQNSKLNSKNSDKKDHPQN